MGKKKVKPNGFSVFMHEYIKNERRQGRQHPKESWAALATPDWNKLGPDQKERYKRLAKTQPARVVVVPPKYTSQGISLDVIAREEQEALEKDAYMKRKVKNVVEDGFLSNDINSRPFYFIMANYFYKTHDGKYSPAELAMVKFSFENGIEKPYHTFINPGTVTIGYAYEAQAHSAKTHRLPPPSSTKGAQPSATGETNYDNVYSGILNMFNARPGQTFSKDDAKRPFVFTREQDIEMIESILDQLSDQQWRQTFDVFHLELLFNRLKNKVESNHGHDELRITVTNAFIEQDRYDATPNISCDFHEKEDATRHCALSYVRRWFYLFADHICLKIGVPLVPGRHLPENVALEAPPPFEDDVYADVNRDGAAAAAFGRNQRKPKRDDDDVSTVSSARTGYSKFQNENESDSSDSEDY